MSTYKDWRDVLRRDMLREAERSRELADDITREMPYLATKDEYATGEEWDLGIYMPRSVGISSTTAPEEIIRRYIEAKEKDDVKATHIPASGSAAEIAERESVREAISRRALDAGTKLLEYGQEQGWTAKDVDMAFQNLYEMVLPFLTPEMKTTMSDLSAGVAAAHKAEAEVPTPLTEDEQIARDLDDLHAF